MSSLIQNTTSSVPTLATIVNLTNYRDNKNKTHKGYTSDGRPVPRAAEPLKSEADIQKIADYFLTGNQQYKYRNYMMFIMGICIGRRAGDLLDLKIRDVFDGSKVITNKKIHIIESKTRKPFDFYLSEGKAVVDAIELYLSSLNRINLDNYLFYSKRANNNGDNVISVRSAWRILNDAAKELGIEAHVGTHTMRKTFGWKVYNETSDPKEALSVLQDMFGHRSTRDTLRYIGDLEESRKKLLMNIDYHLKK